MITNLFYNIQCYYLISLRFLSLIIGLFIFGATWKSNAGGQDQATQYQLLQTTYKIIGDNAVHQKFMTTNASRFQCAYCHNFTFVPNIDSFENVLCLPCAIIIHTFTNEVNIHAEQKQKIRYFLQKFNGLKRYKQYEMAEKLLKSAQLNTYHYKKMFDSSTTAATNTISSKKNEAIYSHLIKCKFYCTDCDDPNNAIISFEKLFDHALLHEVTCNFCDATPFTDETIGEKNFEERMASIKQHEKLCVIKCTFCKKNVASSFFKEHQKACESSIVAYYNGVKWLYLTLANYCQQIVLCVDPYIDSTLVCPMCNYRIGTLHFKEHVQNLHAVATDTDQYLVCSFCTSKPRPKIIANGSALVQHMLEAHPSIWVDLKAKRLRSSFLQHSHTIPATLLKIIELNQYLDSKNEEIVCQCHLTAHTQSYSTQLESLVHSLQETEQTIISSLQQPIFSECYLSTLSYPSIHDFNDYTFKQVPLMLESHAYPNSNGGSSINFNHQAGTIVWKIANIDTKLTLPSITSEPFSLTCEGYTCALTLYLNDQETSTTKKEENDLIKIQLTFIHSPQNDNVIWPFAHPVAFFVPQSTPDPLQNQKHYPRYCCSIQKPTLESPKTFGVKMPILLKSTLNLRYFSENNPLTLHMHVLFKKSFTWKTSLISENPTLLQTPIYPCVTAANESKSSLSTQTSRYALQIAQKSLNQAILISKSNLLAMACLTKIIMHKQDYDQQNFKHLGTLPPPPLEYFHIGQSTHTYCDNNIP